MQAKATQAGKPSEADAQAVGNQASRIATRASRPATDSSKATQSNARQASKPGTQANGQDSAMQANKAYVSYDCIRSLSPHLTATLLVIRHVMRQVSEGRSERYF